MMKDSRAYFSTILFFTHQFVAVGLSTCWDTGPL